jgi:hypothetical protein
MTREEKMQALWQVHLLLEQIEGADEKLVRKLGLLGKGLEIYFYIKEQEYMKALDEFKHLSVEHKERFLRDATNIYDEEK